jgi:hypothetical protein
VPCTPHRVQGGGGAPTKCFSQFGTFCFLPNTGQHHASQQPVALGSSWRSLRGDQATPSPSPPLFRLLSQGLLGRALRPGPWHYSSSICCFTGRGKPQNPNVPVAAAAAQQGWRGGVVAPLRAESPARPAPFAPSLVKVLEQPQVAPKNPPRGEVFRNFSFPTCFLPPNNHENRSGRSDRAAGQKSKFSDHLGHACMPKLGFSGEKSQKKDFLPKFPATRGEFIFCEVFDDFPYPYGGGRVASSPLRAEFDPKKSVLVPQIHAEIETPKGGGRFHRQFQPDFWRLPRQRQKGFGKTFLPESRGQKKSHFCVPRGISGPRPPQVHPRGVF